MRVAAIQTGPANPDRKANLETAVAQLQEIEPRPDLVVFPELFALPFWCVGLSHPRYFDWAEGLDGPTLTTLGAAARAMRNYVLAPFFERGGVEGEYFNSAALLGPDGRPIPGRLPSGERVPTYRKNAISAYQWDGHENDEKYYFRPGCGFPVFDIGLGKVGILICYDRWYPEAWRVLALQGAQIILVPNASEGYVSEMFVPLIRACAAQHLVFAVA
jgi:N-carbamoylputrescine amidase